MLKIIGERIRTLREKENLTQQQLAKKLHRNRETINQWENHSRDLKSEDIKALAEFFKTSADYLLGITHTPENDVTLKEISKTTGLNEKSINTLIDYKTLTAENTDLINKMLSHNEQFEKLLEEIKNYNSISNSSEISDQLETITTFFEYKIDINQTNESPILKFLQNISTTPEKMIGMYEESLKNRFITFIKSL